MSPHYTINEALARIMEVRGVSRRTAKKTLLQWIRAGRLPAFRLVAGQPEPIGVGETVDAITARKVTP